MENPQYKQERKLVHKNPEKYRCYATEIKITNDKLQITNEEKKEKEVIKEKILKALEPAKTIEFQGEPPAPNYNINSFSWRTKQTDSRIFYNIQMNDCGFTISFYYGEVDDKLVKDIEGDNYYGYASYKFLNKNCKRLANDLCIDWTYAIYDEFIYDEINKLIKEYAKKFDNVTRPKPLRVPPNSKNVFINNPGLRHV